MDLKHIAYDNRRSFGPGSALPCGCVSLHCRRTGRVSSDITKDIVIFDQETTVFAYAPDPLVAACACSEGIANAAATNLAAAAAIIGRAKPAPCGHYLQYTVVLTL